MSHKPSLTDEYFTYVQKYKGIYGPDTVVILQNGSFYEMYGLDNETERIFSDIKEVCEILDIFLSRRNKAVAENSRSNPLMAGFPTWSCEKHIQKLVDSGFTVVIFEQRETSEKGIFERSLGQILSPSISMEYKTTSDPQYSLCFYITSGSEYVSRIELWNVSTSVFSILGGSVYLYDTSNCRTESKESVYFDMVRLLCTYETAEILLVLGSLGFQKDVAFWSKQLNYRGTIHIVDAASGDLSKVFENNIRLEEIKKCKYQTAFFDNVYRHIPSLAGITRIETMDLAQHENARISLIFLLQFVYNHNPVLLEKLSVPIWYEHVDGTDPRFCRIENNSLEQLGIFKSGVAHSTRSRAKSFSMSARQQRLECVFDVVNETQTSVGYRFLRESLCRPFVRECDILQRQEMVSMFKSDIVRLETTRIHLSKVCDIEKIHRRIQLGSEWCTDYANLEASYRECIFAFSLWFHVDTGLGLATGETETRAKILGAMEKTCDTIQEAMCKMKQTLNLENCANSPKNQPIELSLFRTGFCTLLDGFLSEKQDILAQIESERKKLEALFQTDNTLEVKKEKKGPVSKKAKTTPVLKTENVEDTEECGKGYSPNNAGIVRLEYTERDKYFFTVSSVRCKNLVSILQKSQDKLCGYYNVKTLTSSGKVTCTELDRLNTLLVQCKEKIDRRTKEMFKDFQRSFCKQFDAHFVSVNHLLGLFDFAQSGATVSIKNAYARPSIAGGESFIDARDLRHPLVEKVLCGTVYVANDVCLGKTKSGYLVFGTNSCGKSVFMKSVGVCVILAQIGYDVPCSSMVFAPFQNIITRMTGGDDALRGHSSFAVEMIELNLILSRSTCRSLVLGDEICHGTEHVSGISLVAASIVSLCAKRVPFVFASHLHQLSKMPEIEQLPGLSMKHLTVRRDVETKTLVYVRKLAEGSGDATYGIEVAKHIVDDRDFIKTAERFQRTILERQAHVVPDRVSRYNPNMFMGKCQICSKKAIETHHVIQQKDADEHKRVVFGDAKTPASVHHMANLVALCVDCHLSIHKKKGKRLKIEGYEDTAEGRRLKYMWLPS